MLARLTVCVFLSGTAALIYQVLWVRLLGLVFGVTIFAASTVLAAFMGGLAVGSYLAGRISDRSRRPAAWFAAAEFVVGSAALATPSLFDSLIPLYRELSATVPDSPAALTLVRLAGSAAILIVPTTAMGATMPLVLRAVVGPGLDVGRRAALLYAANTAGALTGALAAGYVLVSLIGIAATLRLAACLNLAAGLLAAIAVPELPASRATAPATLPECSGANRPEHQRAVLIVFAISGFVSLALEIVWIRTLLMFQAGTIYVFTTILGVVLGGLAAGSAIAAGRRRAPTLRTLARLEAAVGLAALWSFTVLAWTYSAGWRTSAALQGSVVAILPTTLLMGLAFPLGLHYWCRGAADVGSRTGVFYSLNVTLAVAGALAAGFVLLPATGMRGSLLLLSAMSLACAAWLDWLHHSDRRSRIARVAGLAAVFALSAVLVPDPLATALKRRYRGETVRWRYDGPQSTVTVHSGANGVTTLYLDGLHQANDSDSMLAIHRTIGSLGMALHADPQSALIVGLGAGATASAVARFGQGTVTIVELSPGVVRAAEFFRQVNGDVLRQPHVRVRLGDGRNHLLLTDAKYDLITADIIQPFHAGAGSLYSVEYFELVLRALTDDGIAVQWIGHRQRTHYHLIARTFLHTFPYVTAWAGGTLLVGTRQPLQLDARQFRRRAVNPRFVEALHAAGIDGFDALSKTYTAGPAELRAFVGDGPILTDDRPLVEYFRALPSGEADIDLSKLRGNVREVIADTQLPISNSQLPK